MRRLVFRYGLIGGAITSVLMVVAMRFQDEIGFEYGVYVGYASMVLAFMMVYFGVRSYRENVAGGTITFGRAFKVGILITAVTIACYVATWQVVYYKFMPDFGDKYTAYVLEDARRKGATEAELAARTTEMEKAWELYANPLVNIAFTTLEPLPVGLLFTLITAGLLSRKRREERARV